MKLNDETVMWFGIHKGKTLENVPADYLLALYYKNLCGENLKEYIRENMDVLNHEIKNKNS
jgi:uncharacterized protein (DUF3820 family)